MVHVLVSLTLDVLRLENLRAICGRTGDKALALIKLRLDPLLYACVADILVVRTCQSDEQGKVHHILLISTDIA